MATVTDGSLVAAIQLVVETTRELGLDDPQLISYDLIRRYWLDRLHRDLVAVMLSKTYGVIEYISVSFPSSFRPGQTYEYERGGIS